jgi:hypothetical protein
MIDSPTYHYNKTTRTLQSSKINFPVNDSLKLIYGGGMYLSGLAGKGVASTLTGVYELPFEKDGLKIEAVDESGTVSFYFDKQFIILKSDEEWNRKRTQRDSVLLSGQRGIAEINTTITIKNSGILNKTDIIIDLP